MRLEAHLKSYESQIERDAREAKQLKKRINWVTQLKQTQIRSLHGELQSLKT